ncbi:MAG: hypothetical protein M1829_000327 [Trizodia sp. TS-e1964]|nr:MAG: hypothetical protein M1829_000327 [Trizodia sp. TS-e1964]
MDISSMVNEYQQTPTSPPNPSPAPSRESPQQLRMYGGTTMPLKTNPYSRRELVLNGGKPFDLHPSLFTPQQTPPSPPSDAAPRYCLPSISCLLGYTDGNVPGPPSVKQPLIPYQPQPASPVSPYGPPSAPAMMNSNTHGILPPTPPTRPESAFERHRYGERPQEQPTCRPMDRFQPPPKVSGDTAVPSAHSSPLSAPKAVGYIADPNHYRERHHHQLQMVQIQQEQAVVRQQEIDRRIEEDQPRPECPGMAINNMDATNQRQVSPAIQSRHRWPIPVHDHLFISSPYEASPGNPRATIPPKSPVETKTPLYQVIAQAYTPNGFFPLTMQSASGPWQHHHYIHSSRPPYVEQPVDRYICQTCSKAFSRPSSLRIHSHSHTGEKPYRCSIGHCSKAFSVRSNMKRHERGCHGTANSTLNATPANSD